MFQQVWQKKWHTGNYNTENYPAQVKYGRIESKRQVEDWAIIFINMS